MKGGDEMSRIKNVDVLRKELDELATQMSVSINIQHEDVFGSMHRI